MNADLATALTNPDDVIRDFREDVRSILNSIEHWEEDRRCNLAPTECSLAAAKTKVQAILRRLG